MSAAKVERKEEGPFLLSPRGSRLIQVQPTLKCNLRCRHCYSQSSPGPFGYIAADLLLPALAEASSLGYRYVGVSGGEPLLWPDLIRFLQGAATRGFSTSVVTNGTLLTRKRALELKGLAGVIAVSVDGPPKEHNAMRGSVDAFDRMRQGLANLRESGVPFVIMFTLTRANSDRLSWVYEFADSERARAVEVHPLCNFGAAAVNMPNATPDSREFKVASWLLALLAERRGQGGPGVFLDVVERSVVEKSCWPLLAGQYSFRKATPFSDVVPSLIVEPDGCVVPFIYGFPRQWALGFLQHHTLRRDADAWRAECLEPVARIVEATLERLKRSKAGLIDLFGELLKTAHQFASGPTPSNNPPTE